MGGSESSDATVFPREEVEAAFQEFRRRGEEAHDWDAWADMFTEDALYEEHYLGTFHGRAEIKDFITSTMKDYSGSSFWLEWYLIDGNRVSALIPNILPPPPGVDGYFGFDVNTILHYAGNGKWSYEEDVYSPREAQAAVSRWIKAGGVIPSA